MCIRDSDSPFFGKEGKFCTSRHIQERLNKELEKNLALRVQPYEDSTCLLYTSMEAAELNEKVRKHITNAYRLVFHGQTALFDAINQIKDQVPDGPEIQNIIQFLESSEKGVITKM